MNIRSNTIYILFLLCAVTGFAFPVYGSNDSVVAAGFWTRYNKSPHKVLADTVWEKRILEQERKRVRFLYDVDFDNYFDNREYDAPYQIPQTIFNFRLSPSVGLAVRDRIGGIHQFMAGVRYTQRLGGNWRDVQFDPTAYYRFQYKGFDLAFGAIPYEQRIRALPDWLMYDSITYMHPNIQGALFSYHDKRGYVSFMCDWRGAQTDMRREMFRLVVDGEYCYKGLLLGGIAHLNHTASTKLNPPTDPLYDDININVNVGFDATRYVPHIDSLCLRAGYIYGYARDRLNNVLYQPQGFILDFYFNWWFLGLKNTFYYGDNLQPHRPAIGNLMCQGDPFYQAKIYNRTDIFAYLYRSSFVNVYFSWNMHYDGNGLYHQQQLCARFSLQGLMNEPKHSNNHYLRGLFDK